MVMLSLMLDEYHEDDNCLCDHFNPTERQKLLRAKDLLLADLTQASTIAELAREPGLSVLKTKLGFCTLFNNSVVVRAFSARTVAGSQKTTRQW